MFKKLKQKIEGEGVDLAKSPSPPTLPNLLTDTNQTSTSRNHESTTQELKTSDNIKKTAARLDKDCEVDDFSNSFISIADGGANFAERLINKNENSDTVTENWRHDKKLEELKAKVDSLENDKVQLMSRLRNAEVINEKFMQKQEDIEELEGFQTQEVAKVKHLLLLRQQELQIAHSSLEGKEHDLQSANDVIVSLRLELNGLAKEKECWLVEKEKITSEACRLSDLVAEYKDAKQCLEKTILELTEQSKEMKLKCGQLEQAMSDLEDDRDALSHRHEILVNKSASQLEEKCNQITMLEDKVNVLERRQSENNMGSDDRFQAVLHERDDLEQKLEESRLHLTEIKSSWSEKITNLERQISHLNKKISEDSEDSVRQVSEAALKIAQKEKDYEIVSKEVEKLRGGIVEYKQIIQSKEVEIKDLKIAAKSELLLAQNVKEEACKHLEDKILAYENRLSSLEAEKDKEISLFGTKMLQLELKHTERLAAENELQKTIYKLTEEKNNLKGDVQNLESKVAELEKLREQNNDEIDHLKEEITGLHSTLQEKIQCLAQSDTMVLNQAADLKSCSQEKDGLMLRNAELSHQLELSRQSNVEFQKRLEESIKCSSEKIDEVTANLFAAEEERQKLTERISDLESAANLGIETTDTISKLNASVADLENQLADKVKTIKLQQHRISDMKKAMQKELKMQSPYSEPAEVNDREFATQAPTMGKVTSVQLNSYGHHNVHPRQSSLADKLDDISFKYVKHVILRYMTSNEFETPQLVKAIAVLLDFTADEEQLVRETLDWKSSWFGAKPQLHRGNATIYRP